MASPLSSPPLPRWNAPNVIRLFVYIFPHRHPSLPSVYLYIHIHIHSTSLPTNQRYQSTITMSAPNLKGSMDGTTVNGNGTGTTYPPTASNPKARDDEELHRYVTEDQPRSNAAAGTGRATQDGVKGNGLIVSDLKLRWIGSSVLTC